MSSLPVDRQFDLIWLFSVFTHLDAEDANAMLRILRKHIAESGKLFFSAFIAPELTGFEDRLPETPLLNAYFGLNTMTEMLNNNGWEIDSVHLRPTSLPIVNYFICSAK